jgi:putative FmdB family regulatory protein
MIGGIHVRVVGACLRARGRLICYNIHPSSREESMPTYEFRCKKCGEQFTVRQRISEYGAAKAACPKCKSREVERLMSDFYARTPRKS